MNIDELERLLQTLDGGKVYAATDDALECGPHKLSGLALIETGRDEAPWARLCEWDKAILLVEALNALPALLACVKAADAWRAEYGDSKGRGNIGKYDLARRRLTCQT